MGQCSDDGGCSRTAVPGAARCEEHLRHGMACTCDEQPGPCLWCAGYAAGWFAGKKEERERCAEIVDGAAHDLQDDDVMRLSGG